MTGGRPVVGLLTAALALAGCTGAPDGTPPTPPSRPDAAPVLTEVPCLDSANWDAAGPDAQRRRTLDVRCAQLPVPLDHAHPERGTLSMGVMTVRSTRRHDPLGALVLNPGGPGGSGLDAMPGWAATLPPELLQRFDLVTFDPRGTGSSAPISCPLAGRRSSGYRRLPSAAGVPTR